MEVFQIDVQNTAWSVAQHALVNNYAIHLLVVSSDQLKMSTSNDSTLWIFDRVDLNISAYFWLFPILKFDYSAEFLRNGRSMNWIITLVYVYIPIIGSFSFEIPQNILNFLTYGNKLN